MGSCLCDKCSALCCRYFALPIETPETRKQYDDVRWYLVHENCVVFIEKKTWYLAVMAKCKHLQDDNRCGIYETRPRICRKYTTDNCDYHGGEYDYDKLFTSAEQLWEYADEQLKLAREKRLKKRLRESKGKAAKAPAPKAKRPRRPVLVPVSALQRPRLNGSNGSAHVNGNGRAVALPILRS
jgi:uncharacterized protein